ncbi:MAG: Mov34/MPN/PAD-1 family protein [Candidatus Heimdallarchaeota archaeon]|nr:MAG: Mov34/MPN/PAD-1 family protein [Candidatus Heimdallarchaeota archaeon]
MEIETIKPKTTYENILRFTPYAYAKLLYMQNAGPTEVAGFCVTGTEDALLVTDFILIKQNCTQVSFDLDKEDIAEYQERMVDNGLEVWQFARILAHTHPGNSPQPSRTDEENFKNVFTRPSWAIMFIIAEDKSTYCKLKISVGPGVQVILKTQVDFTQQFAASDFPEWEKEYNEKVIKDTIWQDDIDKHKMWWDQERSIFGYDDELDELDCRWDQDGNVIFLDDDGNEYYYDPINKEWFIENENENFLRQISEPRTNWVSKVKKWSQKYAN